MKTEKTDNRRLIIAATAMFALAAGIGGSFLYLQSRATAPAVAAIEKKYYTPDGLTRPRGYDPEVEAARTKVAISRAKDLREKFRPWAVAHQDIIQKMLSAAPTDEAALQTVFDAIPMAPQNAGLSSKDDLSGEPPFAWGSLEKIAKPEDYARQGKLLKRAVKEEKENVLQNFHDYRDMAITSSVNSGGWGVVLWASGRITQYEVMRTRDTRPGRVGSEKAVKEVAPPYDFLQSNVQVGSKNNT